MNTTDPPTPHFPSVEWRFIGEFKLPLGTNAAENISMRLTRILEQLSLPINFRNKIMISAQDAAERLLQVEVVMKFEHVHIMIFVPRDCASKVGTWGFFRVEKLAFTPEEATDSALSIEFYLYLEGA